MTYTPPEPAISTTAFSRDSSTQGYFSTAQLRSEVERVRRETLEEAAKVCDDKAKETFSSQCVTWGDYFGKAIRSLK